MPRSIAGLACVAAVVWAGTAPADTPPRGYRAVVEEVRSLDAAIAAAPVRTDAKLEVVAPPEPLPPDAPADSTVFAVTDTRDDTAPRPGTQRSGWIASTTITLPADAAAFNRLSFWVHVREAPFAMLNPMLVSSEQVLNPELPPKRQLYYPRRTVNGGRWTRIDLDLHHCTEAWRAGLRQFVISAVYSYPQPDESFADYRLHLAGFRLERVANPRKWSGWNPDPQVITVNQIGFKPLSPKTALADAAHPVREFEVKRAADGATIFSGTFAPGRSAATAYLVADFTPLQEPGRYYLASGPLTSVAFDIADRPYRDCIAALMRCLGGMRCGTATIFHATPCHLDDFWSAETGASLDLSGGYHDAADVLRQDHSQTTVQCSRHMFAADILAADDPLRPLFLDETRWCCLVLDKHLKQLGQVSIMHEKQYYLTDNVPGTADDRRLDGRPAGSFLGKAMLGFAGLAGGGPGIDPELAARYREVCAEQVNLMRGRNGTAMAAALRFAADHPDHPLAASLRDGAAAAATHIAQGQETRVFAGSDPCFGGVFPAKADRSLYADLNYASLTDYLDAVGGLAAVLKHLPDHPDWHAWYFAARRYADFCVKSGRRFSAPYQAPVDVLTEEQFAREGAGATPQTVGSLDGRTYVTHPLGHRFTSNSDFVSACSAAFRWGDLARVLDDPELEGVALGIWGFWVGHNPHNWNRIAGFGEDPCTAIWSYYGLEPGLATTYPDMEFYNRTVPLTHIDECWTTTQAYLALDAVNIDAPCRVSGRLTRGGQPVRTTATIAIPGGRELARVATDADGRFGPVAVAGGGGLQLVADGCRYPFAAVAGDSPDLAVDLRDEVVLETDAIIAAGKPVPLVRGFPQLPAGRPVEVRLRVRPLGPGPATHALAIRAAGAKVAPAELTVHTAAEPVDVSFTLTPGAAGETVVLLAEIDGRHDKKWELSAVSQPPVAPGAAGAGDGRP